MRFFFLLEALNFVNKKNLNVFQTLGGCGTALVPHIAVTNCCHGNDSPPKSVRDGFEVGILRARLGKVDGTRE